MSLTFTLEILIVHNQAFSASLAEAKTLNHTQLSVFVKTFLCCFENETNYLHNAYLSGVLIPSPSMIHFQHLQMSPKIKKK